MQALFILLSVAFFALALSIKGGLLGRIFKNWDRVTQELTAKLQFGISDVKDSWANRRWAQLGKAVFLLPFTAFAKWFVDGSVISLFLAFLFVAATQPSLTVAVLFAAAWTLLWSSMGEEAGSAGDYVEWWGKYKDKGFKRDYGIKKGIQYGCFAGAGMALSVGSWALWIAGALFPLCYYLGNSLYRYRHKGAKRGWAYSEPIWGSVVGLAYAFAKMGYLPVSLFTL